MTTGERIKALRPENSNYESIILIGEKMAEATIEGKAVGFTHWFRKQKAPSAVQRAGGMQKGGPLPAPKAFARGTGLVTPLYHITT